MFPIYFIHRFKPLKMGPLCRLGFFLHYLVFSSCILLGCDVTIWDCGQGNMVTAFYKKEAIVFDAGSKAYQSFAQLAEDRDDESSSVAYTISSSEPPADSFFHEAPPSESVQKLRREQVDVLKEELLKDFYASFSNKRLKAVFISHPDLDHVNMINKNVINEMDPLPTFVLGGRPAHKNYAAIRSLNAPLVPEVDLKDQFKIKKCQFGGVSKTSIDILAANEGDTPNSQSLVIKLKGAKHSILLPGDATGVTWDTFNAGGPNAGKDLSSDIFLISHHGSATHGCTTLDLLNKIKPKMCLISAGLMHNHPRKETLDILFQYFEQDTAPYRTKNHLVTGFEGKKLRNYLTNIPIFTTIDNGRLSINLSQKLLTLNTSRDFFYVPSDSLAADGDDPDLLFDVVDNRDFKLKNDFIGADNLTEVTDEIYKTQEGTHWLKRKNLYFKLDPYLYDGENDSSSDEYSDSDGED